MTEGNIGKQLCLFALPLLASSFIQQMYNTVDLIFVGNFVGKSASAAVGASTLIITALVGFFSGMSIGASVIAAQFFGAGDQEKLRQTIQTAIGFSVIGGMVFMMIGYVGAPYFLRWMNTPNEIMTPALSYIRIYFISLISVMTYNMGVGIIRAFGNSKTPMVIQLIGGILNIIMDAIFVVGFQMGVNGVAWATLISQTFAGILVLYLLAHSETEYELHLKEIRIEKGIFYKILIVGIPAGLQILMIVIANIFAQYHINHFDVDAIAAFTAYFKVELPIYLPIIAFGQAITTFSGQNMGAHNLKRIKQGTRVCVLIGIGVTLLVSALLLLFGRQAFRLFTQDAEVIACGMRIIWTTFPFYWIYVFLEVLGDSIRGTGKSAPPMMIILVNICVVRTILLFVIMAFYHDVRGVAATYPITWAITAFCMSVYYLKGKWVSPA